MFTRLFPLFSRKMQKLRKNYSVPWHPGVRLGRMAGSLHPLGAGAVSFRDGCEDSAGVGFLLVDFAEWCAARDAVPCRRTTFELLLQDAGILLRDSMAAGLCSCWLSRASRAHQRPRWPLWTAVVTGMARSMEGGGWHNYRSSSDLLIRHQRVVSLVRDLSLRFAGKIRGNTQRYGALSRAKQAAPNAD
jgi:hypothetical protein